VRPPLHIGLGQPSIILFDGSGLSEVAFEGTEHFAVTKDFLNNYPRRLEQLLRDEACD